MTVRNWLLILLTAVVAYGVSAARTSTADAADPLGTPLPAPVGAGGYRFTALQDDGTARPVAWDPCAPIRFVIRRMGEPPGGEAMLRWAMAEITRVSGLQFVDVGYTDEPPTGDRPIYQGRYGDAPAPVLIAWSAPAESPRLEGDIVGFAGPHGVTGPDAGSARYVSGMVVLDAPQLARHGLTPAGAAIAHMSVLHELGHLVGLGHVDDPGQVMYGEDSLVAGLGDGDLRGLHALGSGRCF